jgi:hypothetical protein
MASETVTLEIPAKLYTELQASASEEQADPAEIIARLVATAQRKRAWLLDLGALREQIRQEGGLQVGTDKQEVVERLRQTRREIFEAEYVHLYR